MPDALRRKYPNAPKEWGWQWGFPATQVSVDPRPGERRRHHLHEAVLQRAVRATARRAGIIKPVGCHTLRQQLKQRGGRRDPRRQVWDIRSAYAVA
ncbi:MAG: hypothetical protein AB1671_25040 [Thermodesulfobacteriota bacterium]